MSTHQLNAESFSLFSPPGETIREILSERSMTQVDLADRTSLDKKTINLIVSGNAPITQDTALALEKVLGLPVSFWLRLEACYQTSLAKNKQRQFLEDCGSWVKSFPYGEMVKLGWIEAASSISDKAQRLLEYFQVANPISWNKVYVEKSLGISYRRVESLSPNLAAAAAWLRQGEVEVSKIECHRPFDASEFRRSLKDMRSLTLLEDFKQISSGIHELCLQAGVIYLPTRELPSLGINGAMRWIGDRPVIQQTLRGKSHDGFWFTFFHEAWHVLQKQKRKVFLEGEEANEDDQVREAEADAMAAEILIPRDEYFNFIRSTPKKSVNLVRDFAKKINIHPGIIVGRLQKEGRMPWNNGPLNSLKTQIHWPSS